MLEIIQQGNKWGRNRLQIKQVLFRNEKDSGHRREDLKPPSDTNLCVGRGAAIQTVLK